MMNNADTIADLMLQWEAARQNGRPVTAPELCTDRPELLGEVQRRISAVIAMEEVFGLTDHGSQLTMVPAAGHMSRWEHGPRPDIPGYDIVRIIDHGGMGVVYEARQKELGRTVAIKMISAGRLKPKVVARFRIEAEAAARLQHPNVVQIFEVGQVNGLPFFSMEFVPGGSLAKLLATQSLPARRAAELIETLARAVHAAHERGIVHRDLKPGNVMLAADGSLKIADFGLAKLLDDDSDHTHTGEILGTPSYMAPEQAEGRKDQIGPATDVYALGAILYEMLAGSPPFQGASPLDSLRMVLSQDPAALSKTQPSVPRDLEAICLKCLEKAPAQRYPSALALADDVRRFLNGQPVVARHIGPMGKSIKWMRRHPQAVALCCTLGLLAMIPVFMLIETYRPHHERRLKAHAQAPLVREILQRNCFECHGQDPRKVEKNLHILNHQEIIDSGRRIVVPGAPDDSRLIQRIADGSMPPEEDELRLPRVSEAELTILRDWILGGAPPFPAADPPEAGPSAVVSSELAAKTKAIFHKHCYDCHKSEMPQGGIKIMHHRLLVTVRKVVVPGRPEDSELLHLLETDDDPLRMPKDADPLSPEEIATVRAWIEEGALPFPKGLTRKEGKR